MVTRTDPSATLSLRSVTVRPIRGLEERRRWDALMAEIEDLRELRAKQVKIVVRFFGLYRLQGIRREGR